MPSPLRPWRGAAGGKEARALKDPFYGDRSGTLMDPFGHPWTIATYKEDLSPEDLTKRADAGMKSGNRP